MVFRLFHIRKLLRSFPAKYILRKNTGNENLGAKTLFSPGQMHLQRPGTFVDRPDVFFP